MKWGEHPWKTMGHWENNGKTNRKLWNLILNHHAPRNLKKNWELMGNQHGFNGVTPAYWNFIEGHLASGPWRRCWLDHRGVSEINSWREKKDQFILNHHGFPIRIVATSSCVCARSSILKTHSACTCRNGRASAAAVPIDPGMKSGRFCRVRHIGREDLVTARTMEKDTLW